MLVIPLVNLVNLVISYFLERFLLVLLVIFLERITLIISRKDSISSISYFSRILSLFLERILLVLLVIFLERITLIISRKDCDF